MSLKLALDSRKSEMLQQFVDAYGTGPSRALLRTYEANLLSQLPLDPPILDLACGDGLVSSVAFGTELDAGCDLMHSQLEKAIARSQYRLLARADARELPYLDSSFASVVSNCSLEHIPEIAQVLSEVNRVLRPNGTLVFTVPNPRFNEWFWKKRFYSRLGLPEKGEASIDEFNRLRQHIHVYDMDVWSDMLAEAGFSSVRSTEYLAHLPTVVFSFLESLWMLTLSLPWPGDQGIQIKRINLPAAALLLLPRGLRTFIQVRFLSLFCRRGEMDRGSHLLVVAHK